MSLTFRYVPDETVLAALGDGARIHRIEHRLRLTHNGIWNQSAISNRLRRLEREGKVRRNPRLTMPSSIWWEPAIAQDHPEAPLPPPPGTEQ